jgi:hypothetical protein
MKWSYAFDVTCVHAHCCSTSGGSVCSVRINGHGPKGGGGRGGGGHWHGGSVSGVEATSYSGSVKQ